MAGLERLLIGRTLDGRYVIEELIGSGRSGSVYRGRHARLGSELAIKVLSLPRKAETRERYRRLFRQEATAAAALRHANLPLVIGSGTDAELDLDFFVTELLEGERLSAVLQQRGRPPAALALRVFADAVAGVAAGHGAGMLHRDLRPANLYLVRAQGEKQKRLRVMGFGVPQIVSRDTLTSSDLALVGYSPPEMFSGGRLTPASDVFGLGAIGYELLAGALPYGEIARRELAVGRAVPLRATPEMEAAPPHVVAAILRALRPDPAERFPDAQSFAAALAEPAAAAEPAPAPPAEPAPIVVAPAPAAPVAVASSHPDDAPDVAEPVASDSVEPAPAPTPVIVAVDAPAPIAELEPPAVAAASTEADVQPAEASEVPALAAAALADPPSAPVEMPVGSQSAETEAVADAAPEATAPAPQAYAPPPPPADRFRAPIPAPAPRRPAAARDLELYYPPEDERPEPAPAALAPVAPPVEAPPAPQPAVAVVPPEPELEPIREADPEIAPVASAFAPVIESPRAAEPPIVAEPALEPQTVLDLSAPEEPRTEAAPLSIAAIPEEPAATEAPAAMPPVPIPARRPFRVAPPSTRPRMRPSMAAGLVLGILITGSVAWVATHRPPAPEGAAAVPAANQLAAGAAATPAADPSSTAPAADSAAQQPARAPVQPIAEPTPAEQNQPTPEERAAQARLAQQQQAAAQQPAAQTPPPTAPAVAQTQFAQRPAAQPAAAPPPAPQPQAAAAPPSAPAPREQLAASAPAPKAAAPEVYDISAVEQRPALVNGPEVARILQERYPRQLQQNRVSGRVTATFVVREDGTVDGSSIRIVDSPNPGFNSPTAAVLRRARFSPARASGQAVKVQVTMPISWAVNE